MRSHLSYRLVVLAYVVVSLVWGSTYLAIRIGVQHVPPGLFGGIRFLGAGVLLLAVALALGKRLPRQRKDWITGAVVGILLLAGGVGIVIWAEQYVESGTAAVIVVTGALWMAVFDALIPGSEARPTWRQVVALLVGFAGTIVLVTGDGAPLGAVGLWGPAALVGASASWALGSIYSKRHPVETDLYVNAALQMVFGGGVLALIGFAAGETGEVRFSPVGVGAIVYLLVFGSIIGYTCFVYLLRHAPATFVGTHYYTNTIVAVLLGWLILDEQVTVRTFVAMATVLGSIVWVRLETETAMGAHGRLRPTTLRPSKTGRPDRPSLSAGYYEYADPTNDIPPRKGQRTMTQAKIDALRESWEPIFQPFAPEEQRAGIALLRDLTRGEPVGAARLADLLGASTSQAESLLKESGLSRYVYWGDDGRVHGFWGLSTVPTLHRFTVNGRTVWAWCAADTLFLPALLGETARVESKDPQSGDVVRLTISPKRVESVEPDEVAVSIIRPDTVDHSDAAKVIRTTCHYIFFFSSRASGERWVAAHPETVLVSLEEAVEFVAWVNARAFGHQLERRRANTA